MVGKFAISLAALASAAAALDPISVKGAHFVDSKGARFDMVGVAYQPGGSAGYNPGSGIDPLSDPKKCLRDAAIMQKAGINTIRVYNLDPNVSHDECAGIFDAAGIYMVLDVNSPLPGESINAAEPWTTYTKAYLTRVFQVIEAFKGYPNLIGFFSGNEIINDMNTGKIDPPYIRAVTRDMKNYIAKNSPNRAIPVGYSAADVRQILEDTSNYLQCNLDNDKDDMSKIDFFGLNSYSWCGESNMQKAGYDVLVKDFSATTIPVFFSEYGCNAVHPRPFTEVNAIYGKDMRSVFSGAIAYEYTQEANDYGLVKLATDGSAQLMDDFENLQQELGKVDWKALASNNASAVSAKAMKCDSSIIKDGSFNKNFTLPALPAGVQDLIDNGVKTGFKGGESVKRPTDTKCPNPVKDSKGQNIPDLAIEPVSNNNRTSLAGYNGTANSNKGASFTQLTNSTNNGTSGGSAGSSVTLSTSALATATPPAPSGTKAPGYGSSNPSTTSSGSGAAGSSKSSSSAAPVQTAGAAAIRVISPISILAVAAGLFVL